MRSSTTMLFAALVLALAVGAQAQKVYHHQFYYVLKDGVDKTAIYPILKKLVDAAPAGAKPLSYQFGPDLGIAKQLYGPIPGATVIPTQAGFGGYLEFKDVPSIKAFFAYLLPLPTFVKLQGDYVKSAQRTQLWNAGKKPAAGTTLYNHAFSYQFPNGAANSKISIDKWTKWVKGSPVQPVSTLWGADLGLGKTIYPASKVANYDFSGTLSFKSQADLVKFWTYLFAKQEYKDWVVKGPVTAATRIQYVSKY